jgi:hypothetical protein
MVREHFENPVQCGNSVQAISTGWTSSPTRCVLYRAVSVAVNQIALSLHIIYCKAIVGTERCRKSIISCFFPNHCLLEMGWFAWCFVTRCVSVVANAADVSFSLMRWEFYLNYISACDFDGTAGRDLIERHSILLVTASCANFYSSAVTRSVCCVWVARFVL